MQQEQKKVRAVFACADDRKLYEEAVRHAEEKYPDYRVCLVTDFGTIFNLVHFEGRLCDHPTIRFMLKHGITEASVYDHEQCKAYEELVAGMSFIHEMDCHTSYMLRFVKRVRAEAIPDFQADINFQQLDVAKKSVAVTHELSEILDLAAG